MAQRWLSLDNRLSKRAKNATPIAIVRLTSAFRASMALRYAAPRSNAQAHFLALQADVPVYNARTDSNASQKLAKMEFVQTRSLAWTHQTLQCSQAAKVTPASTASNARARSAQARLAVPSTSVTPGVVLPKCSAIMPIARVTHNVSMGSVSEIPAAIRWRVPPLMQLLRTNAKGSDAPLMESAASRAPALMASAALSRPALRVHLPSL